MRKSIDYLGIFLILVLGGCTHVNETGKSSKPNVILIMTDDQGFGDLGYYGNPHIKTPVLDKFAGESARFSEFLVSPVCAPTRASLLTGRYSLRTGVHDTYQGGAIMATSEITLAEVLKDAGYKTGMIGKWHLGDNYPFRPEDQGFGYTLRHLSGGIGQWGDWPNHLKFNKSYFSPTLWSNGKIVEREGYCSDVFTNAAIDFVEENKEEPFFLYLAFNAPHDPLQVPQEYYNRYQDIDPASGFENDGRPFPEMTEPMKEKARKVYAMVSNIDDNLGRLFAKIDQLNLKENTLMIFMTDNGPIPYRYLAGMRGRKSSVYEGGIHVPCFWRYPAAFKGNRDIEVTASHFDIFPTIAALCGAKIPDDRKIDGVSLLPLLKEEQSDLPERSICRYWTRREPQRYKNMMVRRGEHKFVGNCDQSSGIEEFELYNLANDPYEQNNIVNSNTKVAIQLKEELDTWLTDMQASPNIVHSPRMVIGTEFENPVYLNLNDVHFTAHKDAEKEVVYWETEIAQAGKYEINLYFKKVIEGNGEVQLKIGKEEQNFSFEHVLDRKLSLGQFDLGKGEADIIPVVLIKEKDKIKYLMPFYVEVKKSKE
ncbi:MULTISPECIES: arylsulfatase [unclassified Saccharicrinis]|uniref:arylsulfatase n=1 Tax=unclassified Saccharicrinis TaxID=2646859 RepID=UPI003D349820